MIRGEHRPESGDVGRGGISLALAIVCVSASGCHATAAAVSVPDELSVGAPARGGVATVDISNMTGYRICYVYASPCSADNWGADRLGETAIMQPGAGWTLRLPVGCWDLRADDCDGQVVVTHMGAQLFNETRWVLGGG